jgi:DNA polymerase III alpha subunit (gram-positive type)
MMPQVAIDRGATAVNGFSVSDGALLLRGTAIPTATLTEALTSFLDFLRSLEQPVLLAAHNAGRFDKPVLDRAILRCSLARQFQQLGSRFLDTLPLSKTLYPRLGSHSLVNLSDHFLGKRYNAHDALEDVTALQELYYCWNLNPRYVARWSF